MFGIRPEDVFRSLLKERLNFSEEENDVDETQLEEFSGIVGSPPHVVREWTLGLGRPTPHEENKIVALLQGLKNFAPKKDEDSQ